MTVMLKVKEAEKKTEKDRALVKEGCGHIRSEDIIIDEDNDTKTKTETEKDRAMVIEGCGHIRSQDIIIDTKTKTWS